MKPDWKILPMTLLALVSFELRGTAQDQDPLPIDDGGVGSTPTGKAAPRSKVPVVVPVAGIEPETVGQVVEAVLALRHDVYACPTCKLKSRAPGPCERCSTPGPRDENESPSELTELEPSTVVERAELQVDRRFLSVTLQPHHWGSLAELDRLLGEFGASVKRRDFRLPAYSRLSITGVADEKAAKRLRNGLVDLKVLPSATVVPGAKENTVWLIPKVGEEAVTVGAIEEALAKMRGEPALVDVQWAAYCTDCGTRPTFEMGSPGCRLH